MRLHRLELEGFGPFRERQVIDFDAFAADGIFLIAGRTGAGKSSVLDGVCFALYGGAPRYDGAEKRLRSDHCAPDDPTSVAVEFSAAGKRWRVTRSPEYERPKQRGTGMTTEPHRAQLDELVDGSWRGRAARPVDVARELDEILGLNQQQFLQVILLAQGRFAEFLLAKNDDRQRLLRKLFGTRTYEDYQNALEQRRKDAERALTAAGDGVAMLLGEAERLVDENPSTHGDATSDAVGAPSPAGAADRPVNAARFEAGERAVQRAAYRAETLARERDAADAAHRAAEAAHAAATSLREKQEQRTHSRAALAALEERASAIAADRETLLRANAAETLRAPIESTARSRRAAAAAADAEDTALVAWVAAGERPDTAELARRIDQLTGDLAVATAATAQERRFEEGQNALAQTRARIDEFEALLARIDAARAGLPEQLAALEAELAARTAAAGALESARSGLDEATARLEAAREAERLAAAQRQAEAAHADALRGLEHSASAVTVLLRRRLAGHAAELAAALVDGEACAVCGSLEHPDPAPGTDEPVTDEHLGAAEELKDAASDAERAAAEHARRARAAYADAAARAGGADVAFLAESRATAQQALRAAEAAASDRDRLAAQRRQLVETDGEAAAEREGLASDLAAARESLAALREQTESARRAVDAARGSFATVAERIAHATSRRRLAQSLADAHADALVRETAARDAAADRDARVAASVFASVDEATEALRDAATRAVLDERIREHDAALRTERDRLRDLELQLAGAPEDPIDLDATAAELAQTRDRWSAAVDAAAHAAQTAARLRELLDRAAAAHAKIADLSDEHAVVARLAHTVAGKAPNTHRMTLESFVLAAELEEIVEAANLRLGDMSSGRYRLQHSDARAARGAASGLGLQIMDAHTGQPRPAQSLSGGETFLASLALALGLAEVVTARAGGVTLDTLFIDEGFGSLDEDTLELAMRTLDELRQGGRTVGLISHVAAMKEQLPAQLLVEATHQGPSVIRQETTVLH
ncbi:MULTISPECIES: SMC family ATPase [unclassified Microbacterium]|uniref:AAA family ATPase n=1 Tax=unclassified Microbacterium TaxID=2609290 RepID=UPI00214AB301|nr:MULTISPECIES: SMC family ATPase [unclassified Microbacterium]MCR2810861.1 SMC family ATPase [Microbacterium sp. zg.B185]WIM19735.1 SMC family ATPase [Microbacterium sp. zg-B185]